jgi:hypothetical protein
MHLYLIQRSYAAQIDLAKEDIGDILKANEDANVDWLFSFLSADKRKTYCLHEATSPEAIREAARIANIPADTIIEVDKVAPETWGFLASTNEMVGGSD